MMPKNQRLLGKTLSNPHGISAKIHGKITIVSDGLGGWAPPEVSYRLVLSEGLRSVEKWRYSGNIMGFDVGNLP